MAMTKAEAASVEALRTKLALRWPEFEEPSPMAMPKLDHGELRTAWHMNAYSGQVEQGCFSMATHSRSRTDKAVSQTQGGPWYETREQATRALLWAVARKCAAEIRRFELRLDSIKPEA